jgi:hypothetical protein
MGANSSKRPRIFWFELGGKWAIRTPPLADQARMKVFTAALRQTCSGVFHQKAEVWLVPDAHLETARKLVTKYYLHHEFIERESKPPSDPLQTTEAALYQTFCELVGWESANYPSREQARALYRQAAARLHPDVGGSPEKMARLNAAWRAIRNSLPQ